MPQDGGGPGGHPGVTLVLLTGDPVADKAALEAAFEAKLKLGGFYTAGGNTFAAFTFGYK
jgi:hypothetical protein